MRKLRWSVRTRRIVVGLGSAAAAASAPPAWAQTCPLTDVLVTDILLKDVLQPVSDSLGNVIGFVTPSGQLIGKPIDNGHPVQSAVQLVDHLVQTGSENVQQNTRSDLENLQPVIENTVNSLCSAIKGLGVQTGITVLSVAGLTGSIMARLDSVRAGGGTGPAPSSGSGNDGMMGLGATTKSQPTPQTGTLGPFTIYASGTVLGGNSTDLPNAAGFTYGANSGMIGLEYSVNRNLILGIAGSFTQMDTDLNTGARTDADVIHGAVYMSYSTRQWFFDALAAYGTVALDMARPGANQPVRASTDATAVGVAARTGYLFDVGKLRVGPMAGLSYISAKVDGYTESGNDPTAMTVADQSIESLTGSAGIRFLAPFQAGGTLFVPYLNVTLEHQFGDGTGSVTTSLTQAPGSPVSLAFPTFGARDYGKVEGGITMELAPEASIGIGGASTFGRDDGQDYRISAGLNYRF